MIAGEPVAIEIVVNKGAMNGFGKLQLDLPEGFEVKEADEKGATYSYSNGIAKWLWAVLPMESEISIHLTIVPSAENLGNKTIGAKYSYVENNVKQVVEMNSAEVTVLAPGSQLLSSVTPTEAGTPVTATKDSLLAQTTVSVESNNEPPGDITATRKIETGNSSAEQVVTVNIRKGITRGFARYSDDLPAGVIVKGAKTDGASFSVADGKIKFVWVSVPEKENLEISYSISSSTNQTITLQGEYSYLEDNQSKKYKLVAETLGFETPIDLVEKTQEPKEPAKPQGQPVVAKVETVSTGVANSKKRPATVIEKKEGNLEFLVQVGAFSRIKVTTKRLEKKFKISETIKSEMMGGYTKFMVGSHNDYKTAREHRTSMVDENGVKTAFVVAYNQGKRVTVQEALMITNQKWFR